MWLPFRAGGGGYVYPFLFCFALRFHVAPQMESQERGKSFGESPPFQTQLCGNQIVWEPPCHALRLGCPRSRGRPREPHSGLSLSDRFAPQTAGGGRSRGSSASQQPAGTSGDQRGTRDVFSHRNPRENRCARRKMTKRAGKVHTRTGERDLGFAPRFHTGEALSRKHTAWPASR